MAGRPDFLEFDIGGGATLGALSWPGLLGAPKVVAVPGEWNTAWVWDPLAHHLAGAAELVAVDLRGRGRSLDQPGPHGLRRHADDIAAIIGQLGGRPVHLVGHSMGAAVALMTAERHPDLVGDLLLIDGGTPTGRELGHHASAESIDDAVVELVGDSLDHVRSVWPDRVSYLSDVALRRPGSDDIGPDEERNLLAELVEVDGGFRRAVDADAVLADARELIGDPEVGSLLERRAEPVTVLRAQYDDSGTGPGPIPPAMRSRFPNHRWIEAPGLGHSSIVESPAGALLVADVLRELLVTS